MSFRQTAAQAPGCQSTSVQAPDLLSGAVRPPHYATGWPRKRPAADAAYTGADTDRVLDLE